MSLKILPPLDYPITSKSIAPLMDGIMQVNILDAGLNEPMQRALGIYLHCIDLYVKSNGKFDYRGKDGHERLKQDAMNFARTDALVHRHGDLAAAHLAIDWSDTAIRCTQAGLPMPANHVNQLLSDCTDLIGLSLHEEKRCGLLLDFAGKKAL